MQEALRRIPPRVELILINLICFGPFAVKSILSLIRQDRLIVYDDAELLTIIAMEVVSGMLAVFILQARGWTLRDLGIRVTMPQTIAGVALFIAATLIIVGINKVFALITGANAPSITPVARASWPVILLLLLIDPIFEETFEVAYNLRATERDGALFAISLSAAIRLLCHVHHGPIAPLTIFPLGIIFAVVYWRWRRVWPLVIAHAMATYFALAPQ